MPFCPWSVLCRLPAHRSWRMRPFLVRLSPFSIIYRSRTNRWVESGCRNCNKCNGLLSTTGTFDAPCFTNEQKSLETKKSISVQLISAKWSQKENLRPSAHISLGVLRHAADCPLGRLVYGLDHPWFLRKPGGISYHFCGSQVASEALRYPGQLGALWFSIRSLDQPVSFHRTLERSLDFWHALVLRHRSFGARLVCRNDCTFVCHFVRQVGGIYNIDTLQTNYTSQTNKRFSSRAANFTSVLVAKNSGPGCSTRVWLLWITWIYSR